MWRDVWERLFERDAPLDDSQQLHYDHENKTTLTYSKKTH